MREERSPTWRQRRPKRSSRDLAQQQALGSMRSDPTALLQLQQQRPASDTEDTVAERFFSGADSGDARRSVTPGPGLGMGLGSGMASGRHAGSGHRPPSIAVQELDDSPRSQRHSLHIPQQPSNVLYN